jgi:hypothetical protein
MDEWMNKKQQWKMSKNIILALSYFQHGGVDLKARVDLT